MKLKNVRLKDMKLDKLRLRKMKLDKEKIKEKTFPIILTSFRIMLAPMVMISLIKQRNDFAAVFFILILSVLLIDGIRTKKKYADSQLRSILEPLANAMMIDLSAIALFMTDQFPLWALIIFISRDLLIFLEGLIFLIRNPNTAFHSNKLRKISNFLESVTILSIMIDKTDFILLSMAAISSIISGIYTLIKTDIVILKRKEVSEYKITKMVKIPDIITLGNAVSGLTSIMFTINNNHKAAATALIFAVIFDFFDGKVARWMKTEGEFGKELDSLADTISFGVAPAVFGYSLIQTKIAMIAFAIFMFAGILRLAKFNIMDAKGVYEGIPITFNGILIPLIYMLGVSAKYYPYIYLMMAVLMIGSFRLKKVI